MELYGFSYVGTWESVEVANFPVEFEEYRLLVNDIDYFPAESWGTDLGIDVSHLNLEYSYDVDFGYGQYPTTESDYPYNVVKNLFLIVNVRRELSNDIKEDCLRLAVEWLSNNI